MPRASAHLTAETTSTSERDFPRVALLGRHPYTTMVTDAGSGVSRHGEILINRWRNDATREAFGQWCYLMNVATRTMWSAAIQPVGGGAGSCDARLSSGTVTLVRRDGDFETITEIGALPDGSGEARRVSISNHSAVDAEVELTSYQEIVLATAASDRGHRAFGNLFVQTEWLPHDASILATRRPRSAQMLPVWCGHSVAASVTPVGEVSCETDRARFLGRGRSARNPAAMETPGELSGSSGAVLDPVLALRTRLMVPAGGRESAIFTTFHARDRAAAVVRARRHSDFSKAADALDAAIAAGDPVLAELAVEPAEGAFYQRLAARLIFGIGRPPEGTRDDLLIAGLTGEWPIVVARVAHDGEVACAAEVLQLHQYWELKGISADLVLLCGTPTTVDLVRRLAPLSSDPPGKTPRILIEDQSTLGPGAVAILETVARLRLTCAGGTITMLND